MKKLFTAIFITFGMINQNASAQNTQTANQTDNTVITMRPELPFKNQFWAENVLPTKDNSNFSSGAKNLDIKIARAKLRASENLTRKYKTASSIEWTSEKTFLMAEYFEGKTRNRVFYDISGRWLHDLSYMFPQDLPNSVVSEVSKSFPDYTVSFGVRVHESVHTRYLLTLVGNATVLKVLSAKGEIHVLETYVSN